MKVVSLACKTTSKNTMKTNVLIQNGELLVLGGLIEDQIGGSASHGFHCWGIYHCWVAFSASPTGRGRSVGTDDVYPPD